MNDQYAMSYVHNANQEPPGVANFEPPAAIQFNEPPPTVTAADRHMDQVDLQQQHSFAPEATQNPQFQPPVSMQGTQFQPQAAPAQEPPLHQLAPQPQVYAPQVSRGERPSGPEPSSVVESSGLAGAAIDLRNHFVSPNFLFDFFLFHPVAASTGNITGASGPCPLPSITVATTQGVLTTAPLASPKEASKEVFDMFQVSAPVGNIIRQPCISTHQLISNSYLGQDLGMGITPKHYKAPPKKVVAAQELRPALNATPPRSTKFAMDDLQDSSDSAWADDDDDLGLDLDDEPEKLPKGRAHRARKTTSVPRPKKPKMPKIGAVKLSAQD
jgi:hypothetical protein